MKLIKKLYELSNSKGILALENSRNKRVLLVRSSDVLTTLSRILKECKSRNKKYRQLNKDYRQIEIKLVDTNNDRLAYAKHLAQYQSQGYTFYSSYKAVQYSIKTDIDYLGHVIVKLVSKAYYEVIIGYFDSIEEADNFVLRNYPNRESITEIKYADNEKSKRMLRNK